MKKKLLLKIFILVFFLYLCLYFTDTIHYISWKYEVNLYKVLFFLKEKPFLKNEDFIEDVSIFTSKFPKLTIVLLAIMKGIVIIEYVKKNLTKSKIVIYSTALFITLLLTIIIYQYSELINFYNSPSNDLPWNYRNIR